MVSIDFFTVPTFTMRMLFVMLLEHERRKVLHFNVTERPTGLGRRNRSQSSSQTRDLIRDRNSRYSAEVRLRIKSLAWRRFSQHERIAA
jgi:hypothetical protein